MPLFPHISSRPLYAVLFMVFLCNLAMLALFPAALLVGPLGDHVGFVGSLALLFALVRYKSDRLLLPRPVLERAHMALDGLIFLQLCWLNLRLFNHLLMMIPFPKVDELLTGWDRALGFDWLAYFEWVHARPMLIEVLDLSYSSLTPLSVFALLGLIAMNRRIEARQFTITFFTTALICMIAGTAFPARAAVLHLIEDFSIYQNFSYLPGTYHIEHLTNLRTAGPETLWLDPNKLPGLVTFPSFHTASGILLIAAYRKTRLALPVWAYSLTMIASTPIFGSHYFVDLLAGTVIALAVVAVVENWDKVKVRLATRTEPQAQPQTITARSL